MTSRRSPGSTALPARFVQRAKIVLLLAEGVSARAVETRLDVSRPTIAKWRRRFLEHGVDGLTNRHRGRPRWKLTVRLRARVLTATRRPPPDGTPHGRAAASRSTSAWTRTSYSASGGRPSCGRTGWPATWRRTTPTSRPTQPTSSGSTWNPPRHAAVFCIDEKTAVQALDRRTGCCRSRRAGSSATDSSTSGTAHCRSTRR